MLRSTLRTLMETWALSTSVICILLIFAIANVKRKIVPRITSVKANVNLVRRCRSPQLFQPLIAPAVEAVELVAERILFVVVLVVLLGTIESCRGVPPGLL